MKKTVFFSIAMALMAIVGCNKNQPSNVDELSYEGPTGKLKVTVALADGETKANQTSGVEGHANEKKIESLQVFVFNKATGRLEAERYETYATPGDGTKTMTLTTLTGEKEVWAITNAPRQTGISSAPTNTEARNQLKAKMSYLENNKVNALQMVGSADVTVAETEANLDAMKDVATSVNIPVKRLAARVTLDKVTVDYTGTQLEGATLQITGMYLKNVVRMCRMDGDASGVGMTFNVVGSYVNAYNYAAVNSGSDAIKA